MEDWIAQFDEKSNKIVIKCLLCNINCDTTVIYDNHCKGKVHMKKVEQRSQFELCKSEGNIRKTNDFPVFNIFHCDICDIDCNTKEQLALHCEGKQHIKKSQKCSYNLMNNDNLSKPDVAQKTPFLEQQNVIVTNNISQLRNVSIDTESQYRPHSEGVKHVKLLNSMKETIVNEQHSNEALDKSSYLQELKKPQFENGKFVCKVCCVRTDTLEQYNIHCAGAKHLKKLNSISMKEFNSTQTSDNYPIHELTSELLSDHSNNDKTIQSSTKKSNSKQYLEEMLQPVIEHGNYICKLCNVLTNTDEQYKLHCSGSKHMKKVTNFGLQDMVECINVMTINSGNDDDYYFCDICSIRIQTVNKQSHLDGRQHSANLVKKCGSETSSTLVSKSGFFTKSDYFQSLKYAPREYQIEIFNKSIETDCVIFLPTGTGKTFIASMIILKMLDENPGLRVAFLVDRVLLVMQQSDFLKLQFADIKLKRFVTGSNDVKEREIRIIGLANEFVSTDHKLSIKDHDVIVATAGLFQGLLQRNHVSWTDFCLVVLDEAHHCSKSHPYSKLLYDYHLFPSHVLKNPYELRSQKSNKEPEVNSSYEDWIKKRCKIIGLTASPAGDLDFDETYELLNELLYNLGNVDVVCVEENMKELGEYTSSTKVDNRRIEYTSDEKELRKLVSNAMVFLIRRFERSIMNNQNLFQLFSPKFDLLVEDISNVKSQLQNNFITDELVNQCTLNHILSLIEIIEAVDSIGYSSGISKLKELIENDNERVWFKSEALNFADDAEKLIKSDNKSDPSLLEAIVTEIKNTTCTNTCRKILLLVKERKLADTIQKNLKDKINNYTVVKIVGHGSAKAPKDTINKKSKGMTVIQQKKALDNIRDETSQIIIATSVADEGIDLPNCDLVILINPPNSVQALVQIRGRARKKSSKLLMLCRDEKCITDLEQLQQRENNIIKSIEKYFKERRH